MRYLLPSLVLILGLSSSIKSQTFEPGIDSRIENLKTHASMAQSVGDYTLAKERLDSAMVLSREIGDVDLITSLGLDKVYIHQILYEADQALALLFDLESLCRENESKSNLADVYNSIGAIYHNQDEFDKAELNYNLSLTIYQELGLKDQLARGYNNFGSLYEDQGNPRLAIKYHRKSYDLWQELENGRWFGVNYMHIGNCYGQLHMHDSAIHYLTQSVEFMASKNAELQLALVTGYLGNAYKASGDLQNGEKYCRQSLEISERIHLVHYEERACKCLYEIYEQRGKSLPALNFHKRFVALRDSVFSQEKTKDLARIEMSHQYAQEQLVDSLRRVRVKFEEDLRHQEELSEQKAGKNRAYLLGLGILLLAGGLWSRLRFIRRSRAIIQKERDRSDELLLNILPEEIADELKETGKAQAKEFENVTILFTDFAGFTQTAAHMSPSELVAEIDACFQGFDRIVGERGVEKIKTIGDAYMAAGGLPVKDEDTVIQAVLAAFEMQDFLKARKADRSSRGLAAFDMRVGIHTGPVVAGIVGVKKFQYDIWGDSVNVASRMESASEVGRINVSKSTYDLIADSPAFTFEYRGAVEVKGKGEMEMYFVERA